MNLLELWTDREKSLTGANRENRAWSLKNGKTSVISVSSCGIISQSISINVSKHGQIR